MRSVHAVWEKRNLDVDCTEITIEPGDLIENISESIEQCMSEYMVVRVPPAQYTAMNYLYQKGFMFMEMLFNLLRSSQEILQITSCFIAAEVKWEYMDENGRRQLFDELEKGMFKTDRVALDPYFTKRKAALRYVHWIRDELNRGSDLLSLRWKDQAIGFCGLRKIDDNSYFQFLTGLYPPFHSRGLGASVVRCAADFIAKKGGKVFTTSVSSNNQASFKTHIKCGCLLDSYHNVLIRHS